MAQGTCSICGKYGRIARGWCMKHYERWRRHGDPLADVRIFGDDRRRFESRVDRSGGLDACHLWLGPPNHKGYGEFKIAGKLLRAHVVAWEYANDRTVPPDHDIDHECHNIAVRAGACHPGICSHRLCYNGKHLIARTKRDHVSGSLNYQTTLTEDQVREIKIALAIGKELQKDIAERFGIAFYTVSAINTGRTWRHVSTADAGSARD